MRQKDRHIFIESSTYGKWLLGDGRGGLFSGALNRQKNKNEKGQEHYAGPLEGKRNIRELNGKSGIKQSTWPLNEGKPSSRCTEGKQTGPRGGGLWANCSFCISGICSKAAHVCTEYIERAHSYPDTRTHTPGCIPADDKKER